MSSVNVMLGYILQGVAKNNPTEKQIDAETQKILKHLPAWKLTA